MQWNATNCKTVSKRPARVLMSWKGGIRLTWSTSRGITGQAWKHGAPCLGVPVSVKLLISFYATSWASFRLQQISIPSKIILLWSYRVVLRRKGTKTWVFLTLNATRFLDRQSKMSLPFESIALNTRGVCDNPDRPYYHLHSDECFKVEAFRWHARKNARKCVPNTAVKGVNDVNGQNMKHSRQKRHILYVHVRIQQTNYIAGLAHHILGAMSLAAQQTIPRLYTAKWRKMRQRPPRF